MRSQSGTFYKIIVTCLLLGVSHLSLSTGSSVDSLKKRGTTTSTTTTTTTTIQTPVVPSVPIPNATSASSENPAVSSNSVEDGASSSVPVNSLEIKEITAKPEARAIKTEPILLKSPKELPKDLPKESLLTAAQSYFIEPPTSTTTTQRPTFTKRKTARPITSYVSEKKKAQEDNFNNEIPQGNPVPFNPFRQIVNTSFGKSRPSSTESKLGRARARPVQTSSTATDVKSNEVPSTTEGEPKPFNRRRPVIRPSTTAPPKDNADAPAAEAPARRFPLRKPRPAGTTSTERTKSNKDAENVAPRGRTIKRRPTTSSTSTTSPLIDMGLGGHSEGDIPSRRIRPIRPLVAGKLMHGNRGSTSTTAASTTTTTETAVTTLDDIKGPFGFPGFPGFPGNGTPPQPGLYPDFSIPEHINNIFNGIGPFPGIPNPYGSGPPGNPVSPATPDAKPISEPVSPAEPAKQLSRVQGGTGTRQGFVLRPKSTASPVEDENEGRPPVRRRKRPQTTTEGPINHNQMHVGGIVGTRIRANEKSPSSPAPPAFRSVVRNPENPSSPVLPPFRSVIRNPESPIPRNPPSQPSPPFRGGVQGSHIPRNPEANPVPRNPSGPGSRGPGRGASLRNPGGPGPRNPVRAPAPVPEFPPQNQNNPQPHHPRAHAIFPDVFGGNVPVSPPRPQLLRNPSHNPGPIGGGASFPNQFDNDGNIRGGFPGFRHPGNNAPAFSGGIVFPGPSDSPDNSPPPKRIPPVTQHSQPNLNQNNWNAHPQRPSNNWGAPPNPSLTNWNSPLNPRPHQNPNNIPPFKPFPVFSNMPVPQSYQFIDEPARPMLEPVIPDYKYNPQPPKTNSIMNPDPAPFKLTTSAPYPVQPGYPSPYASPPQAFPDFRASPQIPPSYNPPIPAPVLPDYNESPHIPSPYHEPAQAPRTPPPNQVPASFRVTTPPSPRVPVSTNTKTKSNPNPSSSSDLSGFNRPQIQHTLNTALGPNNGPPGLFQVPPQSNFRLYPGLDNVLGHSSNIKSVQQKPSSGSLFSSRTTIVPESAESPAKERVSSSSNENQAVIFADTSAPDSGDETFPPSTAITSTTTPTPTKKLSPLEKLQQRQAAAKKFLTPRKPTEKTTTAPAAIKSPINNFRKSVIPPRSLRTRGKSIQEINSSKQENASENESADINNESVQSSEPDTVNNAVPITPVESAEASSEKPSSENAKRRRIPVPNKSSSNSSAQQQQKEKVTQNPEDVPPPPCEDGHRYSKFLKRCVATYKPKVQG